MFLTNQHLDRRTFLRGMGATVALPLLDAMIPARALLASARPVQRLAFVYFPHGAVMSEWAIPATGKVQLGRILEPLSPFANRLTIVSGVENRHAYGPVHAITPGTWLSGNPATGNRHPATGSDGATADQLAANYFGEDTPLPSLALAAEEPKQISAGIWEGQYDENLAKTLSFQAARVPVPMQSNPRAVFNEIFGCGSHGPQSPVSHGPQSPVPGPQSEVLGPQSSVLDRIAEEAARLRARLGPGDRTALNAYLDMVRDLERRVEKLESQIVADPERQFVVRLSLMFDLTALAFRADITRVASLMMAAETSSMTYSHAGVPESFHALSHHQNDPEKLEKLVRIQAFHTRMFADFVKTLAELPDGDASILDRTTILFGSNMSDSNAHDHYPLPLAVIGDGCGAFGGCRHLQYPDRTPMSRLLLTIVPSIAD